MKKFTISCEDKLHDYRAKLAIARQARELATRAIERQKEKIELFHDEIKKCYAILTTAEKNLENANVEVLDNLFQINETLFEGEIYG